MKRRETVTAFDFENAFKALSELDIPKVDKKQNNLNEHFIRSNVTNVLMEDYYDVNDIEDLEQAQNDRQEEIAQAKLARIEKIVDIDAESPEDILPSYVGKHIIQCPQCMTLFYKDPEDVEISEEDETVCNISEICQHCGNDSGYTLVGKVEAVDEVEEEEIPVDEQELADENVEVEEDNEEVQVEENDNSEDEESLNLEPVEEEKTEEVVEELSSLHRDSKEKIAVFIDISGSNSSPSAISRNEELAKSELAKFKDDGAFMTAVLYFADSISADPRSDLGSGTNFAAISAYLDEKNINKAIIITDEDIDANDDGVELQKDSRVKVVKTNTEEVKESLTEAINDELDEKLKAHNDYIEYLKNEIEKAEKELENAKNEFVKKSIKTRLDSLKADLEIALPDALKDEVQNELPAANEIEEVKESLTENLKEESAKELLQDFANSLEEELKETLEEDNLEEDFETEEKLAKFEQKLENFDAEDDKEDLQPAIDSRFEPSKLSEDDVKVQEGFVDDVSSEEFKELVYNPIYHEALEEEFEELDECSLNEHISGYLNNVYENVKSFETTNCAFENDKLIVEGNINFNSGNVNKSKFEFIKEDNSFVGKNNALCEGLSFTLNYKVENKVIITESFKYKYNIGENLVEGIIKK